MKVNWSAMATCFISQGKGVANTCTEWRTTTLTDQFPSLHIHIDRNPRPSTSLFAAQWHCPECLPLLILSTPLSPTVSLMPNLMTTCACIRREVLRVVGKRAPSHSSRSASNWGLTVVRMLATLFWISVLHEEGILLGALAFAKLTRSSLNSRNH